MSHHFDTPTSMEDPRLNLCDFYLFSGRPGFTTMAMAVNPEADLGKDGLFRDEGVYTFRFDTDGDGVEDVSFKVRFSAATHADNGDHEQAFTVVRAEASASRSGVDGDEVVSGHTSHLAGNGEVRAFTGQARDAFAGNAGGNEAFLAAIAQGRYLPEAFDSREDFFGPRQVAVIVLEVPHSMIGSGQVHAWATISLHGHAPEQQVSRWGLPLLTHLYLTTEEQREAYNRTSSEADDSPITTQIGAAIQNITTLAGTTGDPAAYGEQVLTRFGALNLPYEIGTPAAFTLAAFNGRALRDNVMDVMLSLTTNSPLANGFHPDPDRISNDFPYFDVVTHAGRGIE
uniref:DUF4331 family protein n=1 Tax=Paractinoplanes polyasparticus TaxID=2856853 RepID=UPI00210226ED|nr:DUF4331 family protein [Actinoplanes polyasparticus]